MSGKYEYWFSYLTDLSEEGKRTILCDFPELEEFYHLSEGEVNRIRGLTEKDKEKIKRLKAKMKPEEAYGIFLESGISFISLRDKDFPEELKEIRNPPFSLFYIGHLPCREKRRIAIVGSRGRSAYGNEVALRLGRMLGEAGAEVISGMALGIDSDAHNGALEGGGDTYAVLGCSVDNPYPRQNYHLYEQIMAHGGVISEYPLGVSPTPYHFPFRNRIIAALSERVIVVEAKGKSGSLITADLAMEMGREVYAVPGRISDPLSQGPNQLIFQGANVLNDLDAFVKDLALIYMPEALQMDFRKNLLEKEERLVYSLLDFCPMGLGYLVECSGLPLPQLLGILTELTRKGFAKETVPNYFTRTL